ncbi:hypothetical protein QYM36_001077 [Artemia franciscana]|uniref:Uncharacterized protein n=1 Tax=Artemia franciscana TaxID=6661 RepID=A0AA88ID42_ARTSF|nr:hypothetical protein QYM36_001077 [Artemia franciscana]
MGLTLSRAIEITSSMEAADFEAINIKDGVASKIHKFTKANAMPENAPMNEDNWTIFSIRCGSPKVTVALTVRQSNHDIELDIGVAMSLTSEQTYRNCLSCVELTKYNQKLIAHGGHDIPIFVEADVKVTELFSETFGKVKGVKVHLNLKPGAKSKYVKGRVVPLAIPEKVELELSRLLKIGMSEKVNYSDGASSIVSVNKPTSVRTSSESKATVNPSLSQEQYPMPTAEEIFVNLQGGKIF